MALREYTQALSVAIMQACAANLLDDLPLVLLYYKLDVTLTL